MGHSLFRGIQNPDAGFTLYPDEAVWWHFYSHANSPADDWPAGADPGDPEGLNVGNPIAGWVFGNAGANLFNEPGRLNWDGIEQTGVRIALATPATLEDWWGLGKMQRGVVDASGTDLNCAFAVSAARAHGKIRYGAITGFLKSYGGFVPGPDTPGACADLETEINPKFTLIATQAASTYTSCSEKSGTGSAPNTAKPIESWWSDEYNYFIYHQDTTLTTLSREDYVEGPYDSNVYLRKQHGTQITWAINKFSLEFRGSTTDRAVSDYIVDDVGFEFERFLRSQYFLAPCYGIDAYPDNCLAAQYPEFTFSAGAASGSWAPLTGGGNSWSIPAGFVLGGFFIKGTGISKQHNLEIWIGIKYYTARIDSGTTQFLQWIEDCPTGTVQVKTVEGWDTGESCEIEIAPLLAYRPRMDDYYLYLRMATTTDPAGGDADGLSEGTPIQISNDYFQFGCIVNPSRSEIAENLPSGHITENPIYRAVRDLWYDRTRCFNRGSMVGYKVEVNGGLTQSTLIFKRDATISGSDYDMWEGILTPDGTGNGIVLSPSALKKSNEWVLLPVDTSIYKSTGAFKPDAYADITRFLNDRCSTMSDQWGGDDPNFDDFYMKEISDHVAYGQNSMLRTENPPGYRYLSGTHDPPADADTTNQVTNANVIAADEGRKSFFKSCRIYENPYQIISATYDSGTDTVSITLNGRLRATEDAPATIANTAAAWLAAINSENSAASAANRVAERSDENAVLEYLTYVDSGRDCDARVGDFSGSMNTFTADWDTSTSEGSCFPRFYFAKLIPRVFEDGNNSIEPTQDVRVTVDDAIWCEVALRAACEGFVDKASTAASACDRERLFDFTWESLNLQANGRQWFNFLPAYLEPENRKSHGPLPNVALFASHYNQLARCVNLLTAVRIELPIDIEYKSEWIKGRTAITPISGPADDGPCSTPEEEVAAGGSVLWYGSGSFSGYSLATSVDWTTWDAGSAPTSDRYLEIASETVCRGGRRLFQAEGGLLRILWRPEPTQLSLLALPETISDMIAGASGIVLEGVKDLYEFPAFRFNYDPLTWDDAGATPAHFDDGNLVQFDGAPHPRIRFVNDDPLTYQDLTVWPFTDPYDSVEIDLLKSVTSDCEIWNNAGTFEAEDFPSQQIVSNEGIGGVIRPRNLFGVNWLPGTSGNPLVFLDIPLI